MHSCPERVSFLLENVSGVQKASADFQSQTATVHAMGELCHDQTLLIQNLEKGDYGGSVLEIK